MRRKAQRDKPTYTAIRDLRRYVAENNLTDLRSPADELLKGYLNGRELKPFLRFFSIKTEEASQISKEKPLSMNKTEVISRKLTEIYKTLGD